MTPHSTAVLSTTLNTVSTLWRVSSAHAKPRRTGRRPGVAP
jgi:hypothetical protein